MTNQDSQNPSSQPFNKWQAILWPVHRHELKKLIPMLLIFFLLSFDYNVLRCMKDTLVVTAKDSGAEVIPFIKVWAMFPMSVLLTYLFIRLSNRLGREAVVYVMLSIFLLFFFTFAYFVYPYRDELHPHEFCDRLTKLLPIGMKGFVAMIRYWSFSLFYVMSEVWSNIVLFLLFWGFANQVTKLQEAKRFYGLFGIGTNLSGIVAGQSSIFVAEFFQGPNAWDYSLQTLIAIVVGAGLLALGIFYKLNRTIDTHPELQGDYDPTAARPRQSMRDSFKQVFSSKYLLYIAVIVVTYNVVINLVEVLWKHEVRELYPDPRSYNIYMNQVTTWIGIAATLSALLVSGNAIRLLGWTFTAAITPVILFITSLGFFGFFFMKEAPSLALLFPAISPLAMVVLFGTLQNCCSRAAKYTVFDATKEMAFIPLPQQEKLVGKSAIDGVFNRLGKSGGSVVHQTLLIFFGSLTASAPYVAAILFGMIFIWMAAVRNLGVLFTEKAEEVPPTQTQPQPQPVTATI